VARCWAENGDPELFLNAAGHAMTRSRFEYILSKHASQVSPLLDQIDEPIGQVIADSAHDGSPTYQTIAVHSGGIEAMIPPRSTAVPSGKPGLPTQRDSQLAMIAEQGRLGLPALPELPGQSPFCSQGAAGIILSIGIGNAAARHYEPDICDW
jgi:hypothetical protein